MARIVIDARESGTTTGRYIDKLIECLAKIDSNHKFIVLTKKHRLDYLRSIAPNFQHEKCEIKEFSFAEQLLLLKQLRQLKPDLVHFGMTQQPILYTGKTITTVHDLTTIRFRNPAKNWLVFSIKQLVYKFVIKVVSRKSDHIITPSAYVKNDLMKYTKIRPNKISVTHEAADKISTPADPIKYLASKVFIMYVGRPLPHKNLDRLIDAFELLQQTKPELHLALVGKKDSLYTAYAEAVKRRGLINIHFTDFVTEGQLRWLYENTAAYVFPSLSEGFGLPALEAMAHGAPVVSSRLTCLPEIYGDAALYFDPLDIADMASKISSVLNDKQLRDKLRNEGLAQAKKYSWVDMATQTLKIYNDNL